MLPRPKSIFCDRDLAVSFATGAPHNHMTRLRTQENVDTLTPLYRTMLGSPILCAMHILTAKRLAAEKRRNGEESWLRNITITQSWRHDLAASAFDPDINKLLIEIETAQLEGWNNYQLYTEEWYNTESDKLFDNRFAVTAAAIEQASNE